MSKIEPRHWTFMGLFIAITAAMLIDFQLEIPVSEQTQNMYDKIESLPPGSRLIVSFDHEASSLPEIKPIALAILRHAFARGHKLIGVALYAEGTLIGYRLMQETAAELKLYSATSLKRRVASSVFPAASSARAR